MTIELTPQQLQALDSAHGRGVQVIDPRTQATYVLVPLEELEDDRLQQAVRATALWNAVGRAEEEP